MGLQRRELVPEWMDDPALDPVEHRRALAGLRRINTVSGTAAALWREVRRRFNASEGRTLRVLDVACGGGDVTIALRRRALRAGLPIEVHGCDISDEAVRRAGEAAEAEGVDVVFHRVDVLREELPPGCDFAVSSLFLHHLTDADAELLLARLRERVRHMAISDLDRSALGLLACRVGVRLLSRSPVVHVDGPRSVRAAFTAEEARALAGRAGLEGAKVLRGWPFRWVMTWDKPA